MTDQSHDEENHEFKDKTENRDLHDAQPVPDDEFENDADDYERLQDEDDDSA